MTDITDTLTPNSDQLDAVDLLTGPRTFTVERVVVNKSDQPVNVHLRGFPRVWRPGKNMRRVLASLWGADSAAWTGRSVTLYCDKSVRFGGEAVGGIRISHMSHIDGVQKASIIPTRGKSALWTVQPLSDAPAPPTAPANPMQGGEDFPAEQNRLNAMFAEFGNRPDLKDRQARLDYCSNILGRPVESSKDMSAGQVERVINALKVDGAEDQQ